MATNVRVAGVNPLAIKQAAMLSDTVFDHLDVVAAADLVKKTSAVVILDDIKKCYTAAIRKAWPRVNSGRTEDGEVDTSENNPDYTKAISGKRTVWVSYIDTLVLRSAKAMAITAEIETLKESKPSGIGAELDRDEMVKTLSTKLGQYTQTFRKAVRLEQAEQAMAEYYPECKLSYRRDADGDIKQCAEPIKMYPQEEPLLGQNFTVSQFTGLDFKAVFDSGETDPAKKWEILMATKARGTQEDDGEDADNIDINNMPRFETGAASMLTLLEDGGFTSKLYSRFDKAKDIGEHADFIKTLDSLAIELNAIAAKLRAPKPGKGEASSLLSRAIAAEEEQEEEQEAVAAA